MGNNKKDFGSIKNPALDFISSQPEEEQEEPEIQESLESLNDPTATTIKPPKGYKLNPAFVEVKSKRVQLLLQPSVVNAIKALAKKKKISMNEAISDAIKQYLKNEGK